MRRVEIFVPSDPEDYEEAIRDILGYEELEHVDPYTKGLLEDLAYALRIANRA